MKWFKDPTGRFPERPYYDQEEMDSLSEGWVLDFLREKHGEVKFPISTDDLTVLIERETSDLDQYADLSSEGYDVQGVTLFFPGRKPVVKIDQNLASAGNQERRLRTTLTHEFAHVKLHGPLWRFDQLRLFPQDDGPSQRYNRNGVFSATQTDWMEWQAGYVSGAMLMPITSLKGLVHSAFREWGASNSIATESPRGKMLIHRVATHFDVSRDAARVRLAQLGFLTDGRQGGHLMLR